MNQEPMNQDPLSESSAAAYAVEEPVKVNFFGGLLGAVLGAMVGGVVWVLLYRLGYLAGISGIVAVLCGFFGYRLLGGDLDTKGIVITIIATIAVLYLANRVSWAWLIYDELKNEGVTFKECITNVGEYLTEEGHSTYITELMKGYGLSLVGIVGSVVKGRR